MMTDGPLVRLKRRNSRAAWVGGKKSPTASDRCSCYVSKKYSRCERFVQIFTATFPRIQIPGAKALDTSGQPAQKLCSVLLVRHLTFHDTLLPFSLEYAVKTLFRIDPRLTIIQKFGRHLYISEDTREWNGVAPGSNRRHQMCFTKLDSTLR